MEQPNCYKIYVHKNMEILTKFKTFELICHIILDQNIQFPHISNEIFSKFFDKFKIRNRVVLFRNRCKNKRVLFISARLQIKQKCSEL